MLKRRSITFPIALGILTVALSLALLVGWILVIVQNLSLTKEVAQSSWLLALGSVSFVVVITVLVLFSVFLAREIRLVNRQTRFIDSVTHELKSPLASLRLCLETLRREGLDPGHALRLHQMMTDDVERLSIFIDDILEANRLSETPQGHRLEDVVLADLVENCAARLVRQYRQPREVIRLRIPRDLVLITDRTALEIIVKNLLDNALKYSLGTSRPLEVTVQARCESRHVHIEVVDRGVGIPKKHRKRIFDRFYRVPQQDGHARRGTGLGLFVASALVRILGGRLTAESAGVGRGTRMHIWIPREPRDVRKASPRGRRGLARTRS